MTMNTFEKNNANVMSFGEWMVTLLITAIPFVNIIMLIVWAVSSTENPNRVNWARATLAWMAIVILIYIIIFVMILGTALSLSN